MSTKFSMKIKQVKWVLLLSALSFFNTAHVYAANCADDKSTSQSGEWRLWYFRGDSTVSADDCMVNEKTISGSQYTIDVTLGSNVSYANFNIPDVFGLNYVGDGLSDVTYSGLASFEVLDINGVVMDVPVAAGVSFGIGLNYLPINQKGAPRDNIFQIKPHAIPQAFDFSLRETIYSQNQYFSNQFAESKATNFLPRAIGPALKIYQSSNSTEAFRVKVKVDLSVINPVSLTNYPDNTKFDEYKVPFQNTLDALNLQIENDEAFIASISGSSNILLSIKTEASDLVIDKRAIVETYSTRSPYATSLVTPVKLPNPDEYKKLTLISHKLSVLKNNVENIIASVPNSLVHYLWDSTSKWRYDENSFAINNNLSPVVTTIVSQNEFEPVSIVLHNLTESEISNLEITNITLLDPSTGNAFPTAKVDSRIVKSWWTPSATTISLGTQCSTEQCLKDLAILVPELLLKDDALVEVSDELSKNNALRTSLDGASPIYTDISTASSRMPFNATVSDAASLQAFSIASYKSRQLWLTIDSNGVVPGNYVGDITVSFVDGGITKNHLIPFSVIVKPFYLQDSVLDYGIYYHGNLSVDRTDGFIRSRDKNAKQFRAEIQNIKKHGIKYPLQILNTIGSNLEDFLTIRTQEGLPCDKLFFWNGLAEADYKGGSTAEVLANGLELKTRSQTVCPGAEIYMYGIDEAKLQTVIDAEAPYWDVLRNNGLKIYNTIYIGMYDKVEAARNQDGTSYPNADLDIVNFSGKPDLVEIQKWRDAGKGVYSYGHPQSGIPDPYIYRRNYGLSLWQNNYTGAMDFAYQESLESSGTNLDNCRYVMLVDSDYCSPWNDFNDTRWLDHMFTYPTTDGVIDTVQWEGFREAIDDTRYLATLQVLIADNPALSVAQDAQYYLDALKIDGNFDPISARETMQNYIVQIWQMINTAPLLSNVVLTKDDQGTVTVTGEVSDAENNFAAVTIDLDGGNTQQFYDTGVFSHSYASVPDGVYSISVVATDYWDASVTQQVYVDYDKDGEPDTTDIAPLDLFSPHFQGVNLSHSAAFDDPSANNKQFLDSETLHILAWSDSLLVLPATATWELVSGATIRDSGELTAAGQAKSFSASVPLTGLAGNVILNIYIKDGGKGRKAKYYEPSVALTIVGEGIDLPPSVTISTPSNGSSYPEGDLITFTGSADDAVDGDLSTSITWESNIDGYIDTGATVETFELTVGSHQITASAIDTANNTGTFSISVDVTGIAVNCTAYNTVESCPASCRWNKKKQTCR